MIRGMLSAYSKKRQLYLLHLNFKTKRAKDLGNLGN